MSRCIAASQKYRTDHCTLSAWRLSCCPGALTVLTSMIPTMRARLVARRRAPAPYCSHRRTLCAHTDPPVKVVSCFLDMKSPHAYLALGPTQQLQRDYHCTVRWLPYELSFVDLGVTSAPVLASDPYTRLQARPSANSERKVKMYYRTAREYAALQGLQIRGPHKLLDSRLANTALLLAAQAGRALPFMQLVFDAGWSSGWRDYDMEDSAQLQNTLEEVGVRSPPGAEERGAAEHGSDWFGRWAASARAGAEIEAVRAEAEGSGVVGVPHYSLLTDDGRGGEHELGLFGREHLALIRHKLHVQGLARTAEVDSTCSHAWVADSMGGSPARE
jgi:2-hydroxychromene-2-carboxylate isomerase